MAVRLTGFNSAVSKASIEQLTAQICSPVGVFTRCCLFKNWQTGLQSGYHDA